MWWWWWSCSASEVPSVRVVTPRIDERVCGTPLALALEVSNFELVEGPETQGDGTYGHIDVTLNGQVVGMTLETTFELPEVDPGRYLLTADLVNPDHTELDPPAHDEVEFTVDAATCP